MDRDQHGMMAAETSEGLSTGGENGGDDVRQGAWCSICEFIHGKVLLTYLRLRYRHIVRRLMALAVHLEDDLFPALRESNQRWLCLEVSESDCAIGMCGDVRGTASEFPGLAPAGQRFLEFGVRRIRLDTDLEFGQIVDAFVLLLHAGPVLAEVEPARSEVTSWERRAVAGSMKSPAGYHRFCSSMSYDAAEKEYTVEYTYCELFFQRVVKSTVERNATFGDHRVLFTMAPRVTLGMLLVALLCGVSAFYSPALAAGLLGLFAVCASFLAGQLIYGIGAQHYTQEHLDMLVQNYVKTIRRQLGQIQESYDKLAHLEKLRDDLVHMVVHDMKNPLLAVISELEYLEELTGESLGEEEYECLEEAIAGARRLFDMVRSLLDVSRLEQGKMPLNREPCDLHAIAEQAVDVLGPMARDHDVTIRAEDRDPVPCDRDIVRRIIVNLASNAIKYTPKGETIVVALAREDGMHVVRVEDCGPGIPEDMRQKIFEKFGQVEGKHGHKMYSTGLGLTFCKLAVEAHGGQIGVESVVGEGSTFWFTLPHTPPEEAG